MSRPSKPAYAGTYSTVARTIGKTTRGHCLAEKDSGAIRAVFRAPKSKSRGCADMAIQSTISPRRRKNGVQIASSLGPPDSAIAWRDLFSVVFQRQLRPAHIARWKSFERVRTEGRALMRYLAFALA